MLTIEVGNIAGLYVIAEYHFNGSNFFHHLRVLFVRQCRYNEIGSSGGGSLDLELA